VIEAHSSEATAKATLPAIILPPSFEINQLVAGRPEEEKRGPRANIKEGWKGNQLVQGLEEKRYTPPSYM
jgi:hypothetical protein